MTTFYALVPWEELECRKFHRQGGHSDWSTCLLTSPAAYINISSGIFISSHAPWGSIDIWNNAAKRMLRLLNAGAKINFYEPSCSVNAVWHLNFVQESPGGDSLTLHRKADCAVLHCELHVLWPRWTWPWSWTERRRDQQEPCSLKEATYQLGKILFSFVLNTWVNVIYPFFLKNLGVGLL